MLLEKKTFIDELSPFPTCFGHFLALSSFDSGKAFVFQFGEGGCVGTYYNSQVK